MKTIFLDLEETVIQSIDNPILLHENISKIKSFISSEDKIILFSFALWERKDLTEHLSELIFSEFGSFDVVWKMDLFPLFQKRFGIKDILDFMDFSNDKELCFQMFILEEILSGRCGECIFFDDRIRTFDLRINSVLVKFVSVKDF